MLCQQNFMIIIVGNGCQFVMFLYTLSHFSSSSRHEASRGESFCCLPSVPFPVWFPIHVGSLLRTAAGATGQALHHTQAGSSKEEL